MPALTLYADSSWMSPWVFHAVIALEEKRLPYTLETVPLPIPPERKAAMLERSLLAKVPLLVHGDVWLTESLAISEYLAEAFPAPAHPRLFPDGVAARARARQILSWLRTSLGALREARPTSTVFRRPPAVPAPLADKARADYDELVRVASAVVRPGARTMFDEWCIADADLTLALMRLMANQDPLPAHLSDYVLAQCDRRCLRRFIAHLPTAP